MTIGREDTEVRTRSLVALAAPTICLALPAAALADAPAHVTYEAGDDFVVPFCGFPVGVHLEGRLAVISFTDDDGNLARTIEPAAGPVRATLTNLDTLESIELNPAGPGQLRSLADGFSFTTYGPWLSFTSPYAEDFGIFLIRGRQTKTFTSTDFIWEHQGTVVDLCPELAAD